MPCFLPSNALKLFMPTFRTYEGDYRDGIVAWWGFISMSVRVFPAIHNPDGLFVYFCCANLTFHDGFSIRLHSGDMPGFGRRYSKAAVTMFRPLPTARDA